MSNLFSFFHVVMVLSDKAIAITASVILGYNIWWRIHFLHHFTNGCLSQYSEIDESQCLSIYFFLRMAQHNNSKGRNEPSTPTKIQLPRKQLIQRLWVLHLCRLSTVDYPHWIVCHYLHKICKIQCKNPDKDILDEQQTTTLSFCKPTSVEDAWPAV